MKFLLFGMFLAQITLASNSMNCNVPSENPKKLVITLKFQSDEKADFLFVQVSDPFPSTYVTQTDKGEISKSFESKNFSYFLLSDKSQNSNGVVTNSAYLSIENSKGTVAGFLSAKGNIYPLVCAQEH